ncbi:helix-turn-helix transcriptional regulator [Halopiger xanaduensis]|uniref:Transcriptional regulator PadR family protein n=1 Tax=Halopiger xanaduensis (strain DSM 18323 / JCM 14033 / SH-6) TaxID=797210 RepID=F8D5L7_HALXS|nr:helix-turn-helix transcriptional regulator [Halopiger xanaduensis]AEH38856.1 transcriptional regulator PadR family protein [Halopiger xanaduensis SH-6]
MYADDSRGLESPDTTDASLATDQRLVADGGTTWADLSGFQRDVLEAIARLEIADETSYGLAIKRQLEPQYGEVNHGRLYSNLDSLVERGLVEKSTLDKRTNEYVLTDDGHGLLYQRVERLADACEIEVVATDGSGDGDQL